MNTHEFINRLRSLYNIDAGQVPELSDTQWMMFQNNPTRYLMRCDDDIADAIVREVEKRQRQPA